MSRSTARIAAITAGTTLVGLLGYAVYFDYQRRNNPEFRKSLKKQEKKLQHAAEARSKVEKEKTSQALRAAAAELKAEPVPTSPEQQEAYFQEQVAEAEKFATMGPDAYIESAKHFFRALRVYPQPVELLMIYQKVAPPPIFALLIELTTLADDNTARSGAGSSRVPMGIPQPSLSASLNDLDDSIDSPTGQSVASGSGNEWENVNE